MTPGETLRRYREAAGLSREDVALGLPTVPFNIDAFSRADWVRLMEDGVWAISGEDLGQLLALIAALGEVFADRSDAPALGSAAA